MGVDLVVLDAGEFGGEHAQSTGGDGRGEGDQAGLVHAEVVDAVQHNQRGGVGMFAGCVEARADRAAGQRERDLGGGDWFGDDAAQQRRDRLVGDEVQHGDGL